MTHDWRAWQRTTLQLDPGYLRGMRRYRRRALLAGWDVWGWLLSVALLILCLGGLL